MAKRNIIRIDEDKCNGCALCIPNCPEGALQIIDGKARLISDLFCDGLGACIGYCPQGAISVEEREALTYDERKVMENIVKQGKNVIIAHLEHLRVHNEKELLKQALDFLKEKKIEIHLDEGPSHVHHACPSAKIIDLRKKEKTDAGKKTGQNLESEISNWPVQIMLVPAFAPYLNNADLLVAADCVPFAYAPFHLDLLQGKILLVGCPKLDDLDVYREKFKQILANNRINSITYARMEVPCCAGLTGVIQEAISGSGKDIPFKEVIISIKGERLK